MLLKHRIDRALGGIVDLLSLHCREREAVTADPVSAEPLRPHLFTLDVQFQPQ